MRYKIYSCIYVCGKTTWYFYRKPTAWLAARLCEAAREWFVLWHRKTISHIVSFLLILRSFRPRHSSTISFSLSSYFSVGKFPHWRHNPRKTSGKPPGPHQSRHSFDSSRWRQKHLDSGRRRLIVKRPRKFSSQNATGESCTIFGKHLYVENYRRRSG